MELAARAPERVSALVLIETVPSVLDTSLGQLQSLIASQLVRILPKSWLAGLTGFGQAKETRTELRAQLSSIKKETLVAAMQAASQYDGRATLARIDAPTLIVISQDNRATHRGARLAAKSIARSELVSLPGGHMLHLDNPFQLIRAIDFFLKQVVDSSRPDSV